jgi:hypothetical protein
MPSPQHMYHLPDVIRPHLNSLMKNCMQWSGSSSHLGLMTTLDVSIRIEDYMSFCSFCGSAINPRSTCSLPRASWTFSWPFHRTTTQNWSTISNGLGRNIWQTQKSWCRPPEDAKGSAVELQIAESSRHPNCTIWWSTSHVNYALSDRRHMICKTLDVYTTLHVSYVTLPLALEISWECHRGPGIHHQKPSIRSNHPEFHISCVFYQRAWHFKYQASSIHHRALNTEYWILNTEYWIPNTEYCILIAQC